MKMKIEWNPSFPRTISASIHSAGPIPILQKQIGRLSFNQPKPMKKNTTGYQAFTRLELVVIVATLGTEEVHVTFPNGCDVPLL